VTAESMITFVCCVESGSLESYTVRMVRSLRRYGGQFANAPIIAVNPRFGPPLSKKTRRIFDDSNVTYIRRPASTKYSWFKFLNKPFALTAAEELVHSETIGFLDSDLLFVGEPSQLTLLSSEDFLGFPVESKEMGTTGPGDPYEPLWREFCRTLDIDIESLPWVITSQTNQRVRLYFNGGIFVYRRSSHFSQSYLNLCLRLLDSGVATKAAGYAEGVKEMSSVGFAVVKLGLPWRALPYSHDYSMCSGTHSTWYSEDMLRDARIVHYHDSMWPPFFDTFRECLHNTHPDVEHWLASQGPMRNYAPPQWRLLSKMLHKLRAKKETAYLHKCTFV